MAVYPSGKLPDGGHHVWCPYNDISIEGKAFLEAKAAFVQRLPLEGKLAAEPTDEVSLMGTGTTYLKRGPPHPALNGLTGYALLRATLVKGRVRFRFSYRAKACGNNPGAPWCAYAA